MKKLKFYVLVFCIFNFLGCATLQEGAKCVAGVSTKVLEDNRKTAIAETFNYGYFDAYTKTLDTLKDAGAYIYAQDIKKNMITFYVSETDTTPVGVFFKEIESGKTQIEVSSPSTYAKELMAKKIFDNLKPIK